MLGVLQKINVLLQCISVKKDALAFKCERGHSFILTGKVISPVSDLHFYAWNICQADEKYSQYERIRVVVSLCSQLEIEREE